MFLVYYLLEVVCEITLKWLCFTIIEKTTLHHEFTIIISLRIRGLSLSLNLNKNDLKTIEILCHVISSTSFAQVFCLRALQCLSFPLNMKIEKTHSFHINPVVVLKHVTWNWNSKVKTKQTNLIWFNASYQILSNCGFKETVAKNIFIKHIENIFDNV